MLKWLAITLLLLALGWVCFSGMFSLIGRAPKHVPFTSFDSHLPIRGRWLGYALAAILAIVGIVALTVAGANMWVLVAWLAGW